MAEAIGLAASIAGLVQLTGSVFIKVTKFCKEAKDAPSKAQELATQARELAGIFENMRLLVSALEERDSNSALKPQHLESCQKTLTEINSKLDKAQSDFAAGKSAKRFARRLKWPLSLQETKDLVADLANHRANLHLALSADSMDALMKILSKQDEIHNMIERKLSFETRVELNKRRKDVMNFFLRVKPQDYLDVSRELRHKATGSWLTRDDSTFTSWKNGSNSKLWLSGIPGSGKTVLCGLVIETVLEQSDDKTAVCFAFCDYKNPDSCLPENILAALAVQLGLQGEEAFDLLEEYFDMLHPDDNLPTQPRLDDLIELIGCMSEVYEKVFVIVDGLDECGDQVARMTRSLKAVVDGSGTVSSALFSRKEEEIREQLADPFEHIEVSAHIKDLEDYTLAEVSRLHGAQGMFRWVACQIDHICNLPNNKARRKALTELPPTLNETYDRVLQRVMQSPPETQSCIRKFLQWTALGTPKMDIASLCEAVSFQEDMDDFEADDVIEPEVISRNCGCLIRKSLDKNYFEFAHFTVLEYLEKTEIGSFRYSEEDAYRSFLQISLSFLLLRCFDRVPTIVDTIEDRYAKERDLKHPFYKIALFVPVGLQRNPSAYPLHLKVMEEEPVIDLLKYLFSREKSGNFRAWAHALLSGGGTKLSIMHELSNGPLHLAVFLLVPKLCQYLIDNGANVNEVRVDLTPLAMAISIMKDGYHDKQLSDPMFIQCYTEIFKVLLDNGADTAFVTGGWNEIYAKTHSIAEDASCMAQAIGSLDGSYLLQLVRASSGVPEDAVTAFSNFEWKDESDDLVLEAILRLAVGEDACPQWKPLAALALSFSRARGLTLPTIPVNSMAYSYNDPEYRKALEVASRYGLVEELSTLLSDPRFPAVVVKPVDFELLSAAARSTTANSGKIAELLLGSGIDPNLSDSTGKNCLHLSCESKNTEVASIFLRRGVSPGCRDRTGRNSWHTACYNGREKIISLLQKEDKNAFEHLAVLDQAGRTPFSASIHNGHAKAALALLETCPSEAKYFQSKTPIVQEAASTGSLELFTALREKGVVDLDAFKPESTPMHWLSASCTPEFAQYLAKFYDPFYASASGKYPFQIFLERWLAHNDCLELDMTIPLDPDLLKTLIPKDHEFSKTGKVSHAWELDYAGDHFCSISIANLLSEVAESSKIVASLQNIDDSYHLFYLALSRDCPEVLVELIGLGVDIQRRVPESMAEKSPTSLFEMACEEADLETFEAMLDTIPSRNINDIGPTGQNPLELVVKGSSPEKPALIKALSKKGLVASTTDPETPLIVEAAKEDDFEVIKCLADIGHDIFALDSLGWGIAHWAVLDSNLEILKWVVSMSSHPSQWQVLTGMVWPILGEAEPYKEMTDYGATLLHLSADKSDFLSYFLDNHFYDVNITTDYGRTTLHIAAGRGSVVCCQILIDHKINLSVKDQHGKLAVDYALEAGFNDLASLPLEPGSPLPQGRVPAPGDMISGLTSNEGLEVARRRGFEAAILNGNLEQYPSADHNCNEWKGELNSALGGDSPDAFNASLLNHPNTFYSSMRTPLHIAAAGGNTEVIKFLIHEGADIEALDGNRDTPLMVAAWYNHTSAVKELLSCGAFVEGRNKFGNTAMSLAVHLGHLDTVKLLAEECPSSLQYRSMDGSNLLYNASQEESSLEIFKYLLSKGLDIHCKNDGGTSMLYFAMLREKYMEYLSPSRLRDELLISHLRNPDNILTSAIFSSTAIRIKRLYKALAPDDARILLDTRENYNGTPLCLAVSRGDADMVGLFLDLGANIEKVGSWFGTPFMCAISSGNLQMVKLLVRRGAKLEYADDKGGIMSGLEKSLPYPKITQWLLVERFRDQNRLESSAFNDECILKPWSGGGQYVAILQGSHRRRWEESSLDYCIRLAGLKRFMRGKVSFRAFV
ncbi:hypothetical protein FBEOM_4002 [Fusarium beomiforme]|uniref:Nephrocystin 3-like N-terminal domain-containing protein n=1 Tax=Fusarium beomiforme TaxID=44412 RepID=A0A9P5DYM6_9HYPO|nr:hypothetical protein FBEOM_4002 [Fusarium beomiforme]